MLLYELNSDEMKKAIIASVSGLRADNEQDAELLDRIYRTLSSEDISTKIAKSFIPPTQDDTFKLEPLLKILTQMIYHSGVDYKSLVKFLDKLETGSVVNTSVVKAPGIGTVRSFFDGDETATRIFQSIATLGAGKKQKGPGEYALAMLSNKITLKDTGGDISVDGAGIEVKAEMKTGGGRLGEGGPTAAVAKEYWTQLPSIANHISQQATLGLDNFMKYLSIDLPLNDPEKKKQRQEMLGKWYDTIFKNPGPFVEAFMQEDSKRAEIMYGKANFDSYKASHGFDSVLAINFSNLKYICVNNGEDFARYREAGQFGAHGISIIPSAASPKEVFVQLKLTMAKV
tara:strand:- start:3569 stop:4597 length:1029 start_codon:yes stop_codon:yes gene_type:complete